MTPLTAGTDQTDTTVPMNEERRRVTLRLPRPTHDRAELIASATDRTMNDVITDALEEWVRRQADDEGTRVAVEAYLAASSDLFGTNVGTRSENGDKGG